MDPDFWHARWRANEIGFHQDEFNAHLQQFWPDLQVAAGGRVFVPLCGKSRDMLWLAGEGYRVFGVEISPIAVDAFFRENGLESTTVRGDRFLRRTTQEIEIWQGDFFALCPADLADVAAVYDRASLIALPPALRQRYADQMAALLAPGTPMLLITLDYPQSQMDGPPFAVDADEVGALFGAHFQLEGLVRRDILAENPRFQARGLTRLIEHAFRLTRR